MLTHIEVHSPRADLDELTLSIGSVETDTIQIRNIDGLGPVKASVNTTPFASSDGEFSNGNSIGKRNIVLTVGLNPNWIDQSVESLRSLLYAYFITGAGVTLRFFSDERLPCEIFGWVEGCEPILFSKDPQVQISVICPQPDFIGVDPIIIQGEIKSDVEVISGIIDPNDATEIIYGGSVATGFKLTLTSSISNPSYSGHVTIVKILLVVDDISEETETIEFETDIDSTHIVEFSSVHREKYIRSSEIGGITSNLLNVVVGVPVWIRLTPGVNMFGVVSGEEGQTWSMEYFDRHGGL